MIQYEFICYDIILYSINIQNKYIDIGINIHINIDIVRSINRCKYTNIDTNITNISIINKYSYEY